MAIARYSYRNPWHELDQLTSRLGQVFGGMPDSANGGTWVPAVNVEESEDALVLTAEVPGLKKDDIDVEVENNILTIRGEKSVAHEEEGADDKRYHVWERRYGSFQRSFTLPRTVKGDAITAQYLDGILTLNMPKAPEAKSRKISIGEGATGGAKTEVKVK